jgi:hypothetical protein
VTANCSQEADKVLIATSGGILLTSILEIRNKPRGYALELPEATKNSPGTDLGPTQLWELITYFGGTNTGLASWGTTYLQIGAAEYRWSL